MKTQSMFLAALASAPAVLAHTVFTDFYVNGVPQGDGVAIRMSPNPETAGSPIASLDSDDMACNVGGTKGVSRVQSVPDGSVLTFEIRGWANDPSKPRIDRGHQGPCAVYLKKVNSAIDDKGAGPGWFKLFDHGYDSSTKRWCTDEIIDNNGLLSMTLPKGLEGGYYLARPEILALHNAHNGDPQFYTGCAQIFLQSNGNLVPEDTVSIPGYVAYNQPATSFDIYNTDNAKYTVPGPPVAKLTANGAATGSDVQTAQTEGLEPSGCLVENANWCGKEVPSYSNEAGCWAAGEDCYKQGETCYNTSPPTGNAGCKLWQTKCKGIQDQCSAGNFNGPPNKGKVMTPEKKAIDVGKMMATVGGGFVDGPAKPKTSATKKEEAKTDVPAKPTDAPEYESEKPQTPAKTTAAEAQAPKPTGSYESEPENENEDEPESESNDNDDDSNNDSDSAYTPPSKDAKPASSPSQSAPLYTITIPASFSGAPAPTEAPEMCPQGWKCVTEWVTATKTMYVTVVDEAYKRQVGGFMRRRRAHGH